jgi:hypothetical protein
MLVTFSTLQLLQSRSNVHNETTFFGNRRLQVETNSESNKMINLKLVALTIIQPHHEVLQSRQA